VNELVDTTEMYLRTILDLEEEGIAPLRARIVERLHQTGPTVSQTVARMERDGLLVVADDRRIELSAAGRQYAVRVMRKHRLAERLLTDVIGLDWSLVHTEACRWEHVISTDVEQRLVAILDQPQLSPYGNPIPGLDELGGPHTGHGGVAAGQSLNVLVGTAVGPIAVTVDRIGELIQTDIEALEILQRAGLIPGAIVQVVAARNAVQVRPADDPDAGPVAVPDDVAEHVFVSLKGAPAPSVGAVAVGAAPVVAPVG
jgi:DtxR family Mn-dependent transcriptional regulator